MKKTKLTFHKETIAHFGIFELKHHEGGKISHEYGCYLSLEEAFCITNYVSCYCSDPVSDCWQSDGSYNDDCINCIDNPATYNMC